MRSLWNDTEAVQFTGPLGPRIYSSRLLGRDPALVLHGGGNTSVKLHERDRLGHELDILYVKGSGWDLEAIDADGFAPVRMARLLQLAQLDALSDPDMVNELRTQLTRADAPTPSVEAILHAILPHAYVDHSHADAVITVTNSHDGLARIREIYADDVVVVPYVMPGFDLARRCARQFAAEAGPHTQGMVLMHHGIFSFGADARESYERMIALVSRAEDYLDRHKVWSLPQPAATAPAVPQRDSLATLRRAISDCAGFPVILGTHQDACSLDFARRADIAVLSQQGPATPDHVIRTKRVPLLGRDVQAYAADYANYFATHAARASAPKTMLDPAPRVVLDPEFGLCTVGRSAREAAIVADIYQHSMAIMQRAAALGGYQALPPDDIFAVEYWDLEQAKLRAGGKLPAYAGEIALVTGAASGIGRACVVALLARGAAVLGVDIDAAVTTVAQHPAYSGQVCDVTDVQQLETALDAGIRRFGGLDMLILNAGVFPAGCRIESIDAAEWHRVMTVNLDANLMLLRLAHPLLRLAPQGARVVVIGSRNVPAPGIGAAAYSASKAALTQLARIAALEWGGDGIRVNTLHPDAVFDTGIWTEEVLAARARYYDLSVEEYKTRNVLKIEVTSHDVAELAAELCGPLFAKVTGAQLPIDGGNERVI